MSDEKNGPGKHLQQLPRCTHREGRYHDCDYVNAIDTLVRNLPAHGDFHSAIDRLAHERGIRKSIRSVLAGVKTLEEMAQRPPLSTQH